MVYTTIQKNLYNSFGNLFLKLKTQREKTLSNILKLIENGPSKQLNKEKWFISMVYTTIQKNLYNSFGNLFLSFLMRLLCEILN